jgi:hypothetical protein
MSVNVSETNDALAPTLGTQCGQNVSQKTRGRDLRWLSTVNSESIQRFVSPLMLVVWSFWWSVSVYRRDLLGCVKSWFPYPAFGTDFFGGAYLPAKAWLQGRDAYAETGWAYFIYPPPVLRMFAWSGFLYPNTALFIWLGALVSIITMGTYLAWCKRKQFGLCNITLPTAFALVLCSTPVAYAMERGNCDSLSIVFISVGILLWRWNSPFAQFGAGVVLALAPWLKLYPGLLGIGCFGLRRWQALTGFIVGGLVIGALHAEELPKFIRNNRQLSEGYYRQSMAEPDSKVHPWSHSLTQSWASIWTHTPFKFLSRINGFVAAFAILGSLLGWVTYNVYKCPDRDRFAFPFLMWVTALATFVPPAANDYSLVFLPIAAVAVWDRKDPLYVQLMMLALMIWWQPVGLPVSGRLLLVIKVCGLIAIGISLVRRVNEASGRDHTPEIVHTIVG